MKNKYLLLLLTFLSITISRSQVTANAGVDMEACFRDTIELKGSGLGPNDTGVYRWRKISNNSIVANSKNAFVIMQFVGSESYELMVVKTAYNGSFTDFDTVSIRSNPLPTITSINLAPLCFNECPYPLTGNRLAIGKAGYDPNVVDSNLHYFSNGTNNWVTGAPNGPYFYNFCKFLSNGQVPKAGLRDTICFDYTDPKGCYAKSCKPVRFYPNPEVELGSTVVCQAIGMVDLDNLIRKPFSRVGGNESFRCLSVPVGSGIDKNSIVTTSSGSPINFDLLVGNKYTPETAGDYEIEYCFKDVTTGCQTCDTAIVTVNRTPVLDLLPSVPVCINSVPFNLNYYAIDSMTGNSIDGGVWTCVEYNGSRDRSNPNTKDKLDNSVKNGRLFPSIGTGSYRLKFTDDNCGGSDSLVVIVNGLPIVALGHQDTVCVDSAIVLNNLTPSGNVGVWSGPGVTGRIVDARFVDSNVNVSQPYKYKYSYTNPLTNCTSSDSFTMRFRNKPEFLMVHRGYKINGKFLLDCELKAVKRLDTLYDKIIWSFGNGNYSDNFKNTAVPYNDSGTYMVYASLPSHPCEILDSFEVVFDYKLTGIESNLSMQFNYFPNPAGDVLYLFADEIADFNVLGSRGELILSGHLDAGVTNGLDISELSQGFYLLQVNNQYGTAVYRLVKQ